MMTGSRRFLTIAVFALLLVSPACTRSAPLSHDDRVATMVAGTLTGIPPVAPSATADQGTAVTPGITLTPESSPTATSTVTSTPTSTATATPGPNDPRSDLDLTDPDYRDDFSQAGRWFNGYSDAGVSLNFEGEAFAAVDKLTDHMITYSGSVRTEIDFYAEINASIGACSGRDSGGIAVRVSGVNYDAAYVFEVTCNGQYRLRKFIDFNTVPLVPRNWTPSEHINEGPNATNRLGVYAEDDELYLFVNGALLTEDPIEDNDYAEGRFGIFASAVETLNLKVIFDDFALWTLP